MVFCNISIVIYSLGTEKIMKQLILGFNSSSSNYNKNTPKFTPISSKIDTYIINKKTKLDFLKTKLHVAVCILLSIIFYVINDHGNRVISILSSLVKNFGFESF